MKADRRHLPIARAGARVPSVLRDPAMLDELVDRLLSNTRRRRQRTLLCLLPPNPASLRALTRWAAARPELNDRTSEAGPRSDAAHRRIRWLGTERDGLFLRIPDEPGVPPDPALIAGAVGTVRGGGLVVLAVRAGASAASPLFDRLLVCIESESRDATATVTVARLHPAFGGREARRRRAPVVRPSSHVPAARALDGTDLGEQSRLLDAAIARLDADPRATIVIRGPRGVGKSALVGRLLAHRRAVAADDELLVTGPDRASVRMLSRYAGGADFRAPDAIVAHAELTLFVDEASSLPVAVLEGLARGCGRFVCATTAEGYEAAGRAFELRFERSLDRSRPGWLALSPTRRLRWPGNDRIAALIAEAFLLPAPGTRGHAPAERYRAERWRPDRVPSPGGTAGLAVERVPGDALAHASGLLRDIAALISRHHYQSALADIEHLLAGRFEAWVAREGLDLVGAALVAREGGIDPALAPAILAGRRRLPDQLLPQLLARASGDARALGARYARVVRIAVREDARRRGVATALTNAFVGGDAIDAGPGESGRPGEPGGPVDAVGASFAASDAARGFWAAAGFETFHVGTRVNPRSGLVSQAVLRTRDGVLAQLLRDSRYLRITSMPTSVLPSRKPASQ